MSVFGKWMLFTVLLPVYLLASIAQVLADWVTYPYRESRREERWRR